MFYATPEETQRVLRFGDVLKGYPLTTPNILEPILEHHISSYDINVNLPIFSVVMDPCCQIGYQSISLTPLLKIRIKFMSNQFFADDLTRINRKMEHKQTMPTFAWDEMNEEVQMERLKEGNVYTLYNFFIYEKHDLLPKYELIKKDSKIITNYYMINFRYNYRLQCDKINSPEDAPMLESKILQLSLGTRAELRDKMASYYGTPPKEDIELED